MTVRFPPDIESNIRQKVQSGRFGSEAEVVRTALRLLDQREERLRQLRASIDEGFAAIARGEGVELTPELMDELDQEVERLVQIGHQPKPDVCP